MDFKLNKNEEEKTSAATQAAYNAWVLVNDYFSWEKEWSNHVSNGSEGVITNAVFLFMRWYSIDAETSKAMIRKEIVAREEMYCKEKEEFLASGEVTEKTTQWLELLDLVTAGNFVWSMTTARYQLGAEDAYPRLRAECSVAPDTGPAGSLGCPISVSATVLADRIDDVLKDRKYLDLTMREHSDIHNEQTLEKLLGKPTMYQDEMNVFLDDDFDIFINASVISRALASRRIDEESHLPDRKEAERRSAGLLPPLRS